MGNAAPSSSVVLFDQNYGAVNAGLALVGLPDVAWLTSSQWAKPTLALLFLWKTTGFIVIILGGLGNVMAGLVAALLLGELETYGVALTSATLRAVLIIGGIVGALLLFPNGLLARRSTRK